MNAPRFVHALFKSALQDGRRLAKRPQGRKVVDKAYAYARDRALVVNPLRSADEDLALIGACMRPVLLSLRIDRQMLEHMGQRRMVHDVAKAIAHIVHAGVAC